jgi:ketosteroid isomerase-like protein
MTTSVREAFEKGTDAFNAHDIEGFAKLVANDAVLRAPGGILGHGKADCMEFFAGWLSAFPDAHVDVHAVQIVDDVAVEEGTFKGTHSSVLHSPGGDLAPTGRSVELDYIQVLRFRDGKHVSFNLSYDQLSLLEQLGLSPVGAAIA